MRIFYLFIFALSTQFVYAQLTCEDEFILTGNATNLGECIQLTGTGTSQQGCMWLEDPVDFSMPVSHTMTINLGTSNAGADGICLVYQSNNNSTCGIFGGGIGSEGIPNSFIVEFDTWDNGPGVNDITNDHATININGDLSNSIDGPIDLGNIEDGMDYSVTFDWDPATMTYSVFFDGGLIMTGVYDIINNCFGGNNFAYWGFTASTGAAFNNQTVCPGLPPVVVADATGNAATLEIPCIGASIDLDGSFSDSGPEFTYEWTTSDGNIVSGEFTDSPTVDEPGTYTLTVFNTTTMCESMDEVIITQNDLEAQIALPNYLDCFLGEVTLEGGNSTQGPDITYEWTTNDGNIVSTSGSDATVDEPGTYTLTVIYDDGISTCMIDASVEVIEDPDVPFAFSQDAVLTCDPPIIELDGNGSSEGFVYDYQWTTDDGIIVTGENSLFPEVSAEGTYVLEVTNSFTGCTDEYDIFVSVDQDPPFASASVNEDIGCGSTGIVIDGSQSDVGNNIIYDWSTPDGNIVSGADEHSPFVDQAGTYILTVTNTSNGCSEEAFAEVFSNNSTMVANIAPANTLSCTNETIQLDGSGSMPNVNISYNWSTSNGLITGDATQAQVTVSMIGDYQLLITDLLTGCADSTMITVNGNFTPPIAEAGTAAPFQCGDTSLELDGVGSSTSNTTYLWTSTDGQVLSDATSLTPTIGQAGTYFIEVTNTTNGCTAIDSVTVLTDANIPIVNIIVTDSLDCLTDSLSLNASTSSNGANFSFTWSTTDGHISSGQQSLMPFVDAPGIYQLSITNTDNDCSNSANILVVQDTITPSVAIMPTDSVDCLQTSATIFATAPSVDNLIYLWTTTNGSLSSGIDSLEPSVSSGGDYNLHLSNPSTGCTNDYSIFVYEDQEDPIANVSADPFDCSATDLALNGSLSSLGNQFSYNWSTLDGQFIGNTNTHSTNIGQSGTYNLLVTNTDNNCTSDVSITVEVDFSPVIVEAGVGNPFQCGDTTQQLDGQGSSTNNVSYLWTSPNGIINNNSTGLTPIVGSPGTYFLEVTNQTSGCTAIDSVLVATDDDIPLVQISVSDTLDCTTDSLLLDAQGSSFGPNFSFTWSSPNGNISSGDQSLTPFVNEAGTYQLFITNTDNDCFNNAFITVIQDTISPDLSISPSTIIDCNNPISTLQGMTLSDANLNFEWSTTDGLVDNGANTIEASTSSAGTYQLLIEDLENGCTSIRSTTVDIDTITPTAIIALPNEITCLETEINLDGSASFGNSNLSFLWSTINGNIIDNTTNNQITVDQEASYMLLVSDDVNGCQDSVSVQVIQNTNFPIVNIETPLVLTCGRTSLDLMATATTASGNMQLDWTTIDGNITANENTLSPSINMPGIYTLMVEDTDNNCPTERSIEVLLDDTPPIAEIINEDVLDCGQISIELSAENSDQGNLINYIWSTTDGNITSNTDGIIINTDTPGTYQLEVINTDNECNTIVNTVVTQDTISPIVQINVADTLTCAVTAVVLDGSNASNSSEYTYNWTNSNGNDITNADSNIASVSDAGVYVFTVFNTINECDHFAIVNVEDNYTTPIINITTPDSLDCDTPSVLLSSNSTNNNLLYDWTSDTGNILNGENLADAEINQIGIYTLVVTDQNNGCSETTSTEVFQDEDLPVVQIADPAELNCIVETLVLDASLSSEGPSFIYTWTTTNGTIVSGDDGLLLEINAPGIYTLSILDQGNGCSHSDFTTVTQNIINPTANAGTDMELSCLTQNGILNGSISSQGDQYTYLWSSGNGSTIVDEATLSPTIQATGLYTLEVINTNNGCTDMDEVLVFQDIPTATFESFDAQCYGETGFINVTQTNGGSPPILYSIDGGQNFQTQGFFNNLPAGQYNLVVEDFNNCQFVEDIEVTQPDSLIVSILDPAIEISYGDSVNILAQSNFDESLLFIDWQHDGGLQCDTCLVSLAKPLESTQYQINVRTAAGCSDQSTVRIIVNKDRPVYIPSGFSPNGDGDNDFFYIFAKNGIVKNINSLQIFSRWGEPMFEIYDFLPNDPRYGWDGKKNDLPLNTGVFVYVAEIEFNDGTVEIYKGDVMIVR